MSASSMIDGRIGDIGSVEGLMARDACHRPWSERHPDVPMFSHAKGGRRRGRKMPAFCTDVVSAYQGTMQSRQTGHIVPSPLDIWLVCRVTGEDVTDETHHIDFVRRQAANDIWNHTLNEVRLSSANIERQDELYEPVFDQ